MGFQTEGILFMVIVWASVLALVVYCFSRVFLSERKDKAVSKSGMGGKKPG